MTKNITIRAIKEVAKSHWRILPIMLTACGTIAFGLLLMFAEMTFNDPVGGPTVARWVFRFAGFVLFISPLWTYWRTKRGYYDEGEAQP